MRSPRQIAVNCLCDVEAGAYSNLAFKQWVSGTGLGSRDVQFCARLFYGTLERTVTLDYILSQFIDRDIHKLDAEVRAILRCGLFQIHYMDAVPPPVAVNESVRLCTIFKKKSASGLVNAVLRRSVQYDRTQIDGIADETERLAVKYSVVPELAQLLLDQYGDRAADMLAATLQRAPTAVRVNSLRTTPQQLIQRLADEGIEAEPAPVQDSLLIRSGRYIGSSALADGTMRIQSVAAQYAVQLLSPKPGMTVLDACAAPGGKTLTIAQKMENNGTITALDIHEHRLRLIAEQAALEGITIVGLHCADATDFDGGEQYDRILCDVPCSGYGEMAQKPELRQKSPPKNNELPLLQRKILDNSAKMLRKGGRLVYSTCTLDKRENEAVVDAFLKEHPDFVPIAAKNLPPSSEVVQQYVKFTPQNSYNEGFFIATLERM